MHELQTRSPDRLPDHAWFTIVSRVRGEFEEMPSLRVTPEQAKILFGLDGPVSSWVLSRLTRDGFLARTKDGEYMRRDARP
jgi:hypothetical protein